MITNKYQIWLEAERKKIQLPINPETVKITRNGNNESVTIANLGEATLIQNPKAPTISFSSFFPAHYFSGCNVKKPLLPHYYISKINSWMQNKLPVRLYITGCDIVWFVTIESFQYSQSGGDVGTYDYSLTLKQYKSIRVIQLKIEDKKASAQKTSSRVNTQSKPKTYTVKNGDCLWNIAKKYYGDGSQFMKIYNANKDVIGANYNLIYAGTVLTIP